MQAQPGVAASRKANGPNWAGKFWWTNSTCMGTRYPGGKTAAPAGEGRGRGGRRRWWAATSRRPLRRHSKLSNPSHVSGPAGPLTVLFFSPSVPAPPRTLIELPFT